MEYNELKISNTKENAKKKIITALIVFAVVIIAGAIASVAVIAKNEKKQEFQAFSRFFGPFHSCASPLEYFSIKNMHLCPPIVQVYSERIQKRQFGSNDLLPLCVISPHSRPQYSPPSQTRRCCPRPFPSAHQTGSYAV